jgi:ubiquinone/menaquinone biosynthesis C-methylase UbiE
MGQTGLFAASAMPDRDWWRALWPDPDATVRALGIRADMHVIDVCCADGYFTAAIAREVGSGSVVGVDLDPAMLEQAKAACRGINRCALLLGGARELSRLVVGGADYVLCANTFHGVDDKPALAREAARVLKPNGRFAIVNWHPAPREKTLVLGKPRGPRTELRMSPQKTRAVVEPQGFALDKLVELPPYHYAIIFKSVKEISKAQNCFARRQ